MAQNQNQPLSYTLVERIARIGKHKDKKVKQAQVTHRGSVPFERFCTLVAGHTTFNYMEVASVLNLAADKARDLVINGNSVEYGRLGYLSPSLRSVQVAEGETFDANKHIKQARVVLRPKRRYFDLSDMRYVRFDGQPSSAPAPKESGSATVTPGASGEEHSDTI